MYERVLFRVEVFFALAFIAVVYLNIGHFMRRWFYHALKNRESRSDLIFFLGVDWWSEFIHYYFVMGAKPDRFTTLACAVSWPLYLSISWFFGIATWLVILIIYAVAYAVYGIVVAFNGTLVKKISPRPT